MMYKNQKGFHHHPGSQTSYRWPASVGTLPYRFSILMFRVFWAYLWWRGHSTLPAATAAYRGYGLTGNRCITAACGIKDRWNTGNRCASPEPLNHTSKHAQLPVLLLLRRHTKAQCTRSLQERTLNPRRPSGEQRTPPGGSQRQRRTR